MKIQIALVASMVGTLFASTAFADDLGVAASAKPKASLGAQIDLLPTGTLTTDGAGPPIDGDYDAAFAFGIGVNFDYDLTPNISIGLAPRVIFNVIADAASDDADSDKEIDLRARVRAHFPIADKLEAFGFLAPGYSIIVLPSDFDIDNPAGLVVAFGAGLSYDVSDKLYLTGEIGYQLGFQSVDVGGQSIDNTTDYLHFGFGAGTRF